VVTLSLCFGVMTTLQVMILLDNSEFCRNGDYSPSRLDAQNETANLIAGSKTQSNAETTVGFLSMAGARLVPLCFRQNKLKKAAHDSWCVYCVCTAVWTCT
jgi:hypothetical protein